LGEDAVNEAQGVMHEFAKSVGPAVWKRFRKYLGPSLPLEALLRGIDIDDSDIKTCSDNDDPF
jgi:hypothetical protein